MRSPKLRTASVLASLALIAAAGSASLAFAATGGPTVVLSSATASTTNSTSIPVTVTFSESVNGFALSDIQTTNATTNGLSGSGASYTFNLVPNASGSVTAQIAADMATSSSSSIGSQASNVLTFTSNMVMPSISNIIATGMGSSTEQITWNTDTPGNTQVFYGTTASYGSSSTLDTTASTTHSVTLNNLSEGTVYHYQAVSMGEGGTASSTDQVFTSGTTASSTPLAVTSVDTISGTATADGTFTNGFRWVLHFIVPSNETSFQMKFADFTTSGGSGTIPVANNVRYYSAQSSNASTADSAIVESGNGYGGAFTLTGDTGTSTAGRQIDVTVEAAVPAGTPTGLYSTTFGALSATTTP
jgi:hypothetical protein